MIVNMHEAKTNLSKLVERAVAGEEIIIGKAGTPRVRLVPYVERRAPRKPGSARGKVFIADDFDEMPQEIIDAFEGNA